MKYETVFCSQCGQAFGPGDHGYSHCEDHREITLASRAAWRKEERKQKDHRLYKSQMVPSAADRMKSRVMAAAPDLLAALRHIVDAVPSGNALTYVQAIARKAIAKATGEGE